LLFYLVAGVTAGLVHCFLNPDSTVPAVGASGAIAGVLGAYFFLYPHARIIAMVPIFFWPFFFELPAITYLGFWILSQIFSGTLSLALPQDVGGIAWWAHVGGFIAGAAFHRLFVNRRRSMRRLEPDEWGLEGAWLRGVNRDPWRW
jgi:membrane associated rhomboid family serine protease